MERKRENNRLGGSPGREQGPVAPRRLSYEEERRRRDRPWSPSQQPGVGSDEMLYTAEVSTQNRPEGSNDRVSGLRGNRGKGPKGYTRSDERIKEVICDRMMDDDLLDASDITVGVENGEVTLTGSVTERGAKRYAEELAYDVAGVADVQNSIRVASRD